ncbi:MAG: molybdopterin-dependent oxidoreductase [Planctomycetes bacterium]|nr:molybdopterin-dependent oxidoreductase [Planctomycetota bacterium]
MNTPLVSRRGFLQSVGAFGIGLSCGWRGSPLLRADDTVVQPAGKRLIVRTADPFNAEGVVDKLLSNWITPLESFYVRNHGPTPHLVTAEHQLSIEGLVDRPLKLSIAELLQKFPKYQTTATLTCAGNRRNEFQGPKIGGVQWGTGAVGNAQWSGVTLAAVLRHVGLQNGARHVWFEGADIIKDKAESYPFGGSIPLEKVLDVDAALPQALLATHMNDQPLTAEHGAPLRTIVPGYIGARSVKWLNRIVVSDRPSPNHYLAHAYKLIADEKLATIEAAEPIYEIAINSIAAAPAADAAKDTGDITLRGWALPGGKTGSTIKRVEISTDDGQSWKAAQIGTPNQAACWAFWSVPIARGSQSVWVRATDSTGLTQPREMVWNAKGYQYNAWQQLKLSQGN